MNRSGGVAAAWALLLSAGCGLPTSSEPAAVRSVVLAQASLTVTGYLGDPGGPTAQVLVQRSGLGTGLFVATQPRVVVSASADFIGDERTTELWVTLAPPDQFGIGTHHAVLEFQACALPACAAGEGAPLRLELTYVVRPPVLALSVSQVSFEHWIGGATPPPVTVALEGEPGFGPWSLSNWSGSLPPWLEVSPASGEALPTTLTLSVVGPAPADVFYPQNYSLTVTRAGRTRYLQVRREVRHPLAYLPPGPVSLQITSNQQDLPPPVVLATTSDLDLPVPFQPDIDYLYGQSTSGQVDWLSVTAPGGGLPAAPGPVLLGLARTNLPPGLYVAEVRTRGDQPPLRVVLEVLLPSAVVAPRATVITVTDDTGPAQAFTTFQLTASGGAGTFTVESLVPWLVPSPASGAVDLGGAVGLTLRVSPAGLEALQTGYHQGQALVLFTGADGQVLRYDLAVELRLLLSSVMEVAPRGGPAGSLRPVQVVRSTYGSTTDPWTLTIGGLVAPPVGASPWPPRFQPPLLPPGRHPVQVVNALGVKRGQAVYEVYAPWTPAAAAIPSPGRKTRLLLDDGSTALLTVNTAASSLERHQHGGGAWTSAAVEVPSLQDAAFTPDGRQLLVVAAGAPPTLREAATLDLSAAQPQGEPVPAGPTWRVTLRTYGTGRILPDALRCGAEACPEFEYQHRDLRVLRQYLGLQGATAGSSRAVDRVAYVSALIAGQLTMEGIDGWLPFPWEPKLVAPFTPTSVTLDEHGDRGLLLKDGTAGGGASILFDAAGLALPGHLPPTIAAALLTQGGDVAVAFDGASRTVRRFDLTSAPDLATGEFAELGPAGGFAPLDDPGAGVVLALAADDRTLFVGGDDRILVVPLP